MLLLFWWYGYRACAFSVHNIQICSLLLPPISDKPLGAACLNLVCSLVGRQVVVYLNSWALEGRVSLKH